MPKIVVYKTIEHMSSPRQGRAGSGSSSESASATAGCGRTRPEHQLRVAPPVIGKLPLGAARPAGRRPCRRRVVRQRRGADRPVLHRGEGLPERPSRQGRPAAAIWRRPSPSVPQHRHGEAVVQAVHVDVVSADAGRGSCRDHQVRTTASSTASRFTRRLRAGSRFCLRPMATWPSSLLTTGRGVGASSHRSSSSLCSTSRRSE